MVNKKLNIDKGEKSNKIGLFWLVLDQEQFINRLGVAGAVLETALSLIKVNKVSHGLWKYLYGAAMPQWLEMGLSVIK